MTHRQEHRQHRLAIEKIYQEQQHRYYDKDGMAYPLVKVSKTHSVALPPAEAAKLSQSSDDEGVRI
ncbi:hypothetical protein HMPREF9103_02128 [Lentilactobacillus parafarraginis F0439]|uniref:Uncharacterized protein n=1 Tax=Lentilactobacillus parafarraginis F0439 TaxID=797515 RepID=G9ZQX0_9LACO|nr:hypothetical protein HMPREF9103_02128 [Lentilactobacillus parafarraginis F0439]